MLIADTHVHMYPVHDANNLLASAWHNIVRLSPTTVDLYAGLFLVERAGESYYRQLASGECSPPGNFRVEPAAEPGALLLTEPTLACRLLLYAGRQIVPRERIEILCLAADVEIPDGLSAVETIQHIRAAGGLPVLSWAPGKWLFKRGDVVRALIDERNNNPLAIGDTCMRARGLPIPPLMDAAMKRGIPVLAGSDPLPFPGDETCAGSYGILSTVFDSARPVTSVRSLLAAGTFITVGVRNTILTATRRWQQNRSARTS